jgi:hypothetical protein
MDYFSKKYESSLKRLEQVQDQLEEEEDKETKKDQ